jgi:hypothetical protein
MRSGVEHYMRLLLIEELSVVSIIRVLYYECWQGEDHISCYRLCLVAMQT